MEGPAVPSSCHFCGESDLPGPVNVKSQEEKGQTLTHIELEGLQYFHRRSASHPARPTSSYSLGDHLEVCFLCQEPFAQLCALLKELQALKVKLDKAKGQLEQRVKVNDIKEIEETGREEFMEQVQVKVEEASDPDLDGDDCFDPEIGDDSALFDEKGPFVKIEINPDEPESPTASSQCKSEPEPDRENPTTKRRGTRNSSRASARAREDDVAVPNTKNKRKQTKPSSRVQKQGAKKSKTKAEIPVVSDDIGFNDIEESETEGSDNEDEDPSFQVQATPKLAKPSDAWVSIEYKRQCLDYVAEHPNQTFKTISKRFDDRKKSLPPKISIPTCSECGKTFKKNYHLNLHVKRVHQGGINQVCEICGKVISKRSIKDHLNSHNGIRPYSCSYCGKSFVRESTYKEHSRIHTGEKPYECNLCGRKFRQDGGLRAHLISHERRGDDVRKTDRVRKQTEQEVEKVVSSPLQEQLGPDDWNQILSI